MMKWFGGLLIGGAWWFGIAGMTYNLPTTYMVPIAIVAVIGFVVSVVGV